MMSESISRIRDQVRELRSEAAARIEAADALERLYQPEARASGTPNGHAAPASRGRRTRTKGDMVRDVVSKMRDGHLFTLAEIRDTTGVSIVTSWGVVDDMVRDGHARIVTKHRGSRPAVYARCV